MIDDKEGAGSRNRDALPLDIVEWPVPPYAGTAIRRLFVAVLCPQIPYAPCLTSANSDIYLSMRENCFYSITSNTCIHSTQAPRSPQFRVRNNSPRTRNTITIVN